LFNVGYLAFSAFAGGGDWGNVISGLSPAWLWRLAVGLAGIALYVIAFRWLASFVITFVDRGEISLSDLRRLVWPAYLAGGVVLTIAAAFNPISRSLILISGIGASFGLNFGFLLLPGIVATAERGAPGSNTPIPFSPRWLILSLAISLVFVGLIGPGI